MNSIPQERTDAPETAIQSREYHPDTATFACLSWDAFSTTVSIIPLIGKALRWSRPSIALLTSIITILDGAPSVSISHQKFASLFCPDLAKRPGAEKIRRAINSLLFDMKCSKFTAIFIKRGSKKEHDDGTEFIDTEYRLGKIRALTSEIQQAAVNADLFSLPPRERARKLESLIRSILANNDYQPVTREQREDLKAEKLARKQGTTGQIADTETTESNTSPRDERVTLEDIERRKAAAYEILFGCAIDYARLGWSTDHIREKALTIPGNELMMRLESAIARANRPRLVNQELKDTLYPTWADGTPKPF